MWQALFVNALGVLVSFLPHILQVRSRGTERSATCLRAHSTNGRVWNDPSSLTLSPGSRCDIWGQVQPPCSLQDRSLPALGPPSICSHPNWAACSSRHLPFTLPSPHFCSGHFFLSRSFPAMPCPPIHSIHSPRSSSDTCSCIKPSPALQLEAISLSFGLPRACNSLLWHLPHVPCIISIPRFSLALCRL